MIVLGDISGIQNYVFDVAEEGGGQAQRLRARSFYVQLLAETAALRVLRALDWPLDAAHFLLSGAGKYMLRGPMAAGIEQSLAQEQQTINEWLRGESRAELRFTLAWSNSGPNDTAAYNDAQRYLQENKARPWAPAQGDSWRAAGLVLAPLDTPCDLCRHAPATEAETDRETGEVRRVCHTCAANRRLGRRLPRANWLIIGDTPQPDDLAVLGWSAAVAAQPPGSLGQDTVAVAKLGEPAVCPSWCPTQLFLERRLMAHVPTDDHGHPVWFTELVRNAQGDHLLGVLKADADSLGVRFHELLRSSGLAGMTRLSEQLDAFFAGRLRHELANDPAGRWQSIYTIFAGGDDLVMVGPWDVMLDFVGKMREWFTEEFRSHGLTLSASVALMKPKRPIKGGVAEAERLLELAKTGTKNRLAAFGQVWNWQHHDDIIKTARQLVEWVTCGEMERGWLHTALELIEGRHGPTPDPLATARLAYHVSRNYRRNTHARLWAERLVERFDNSENFDVRYLPAIVRYALTATRTRGEED